MEPEPDKPDLSALDPTRDEVRWERAIAHVAGRALELRRLRRAVVRRGVTAVVLAAAAAAVLWLTAPRRTATAHAARHSLLDWAVRDADPGEVLQLGGLDAQ